MGAINARNGLPEAQAAGMNWVRRNGVQWDRVQPSGPGSYNWSALSGLESELVAAQNAGLTPILVVRGAPGWAQKVPGKTCGPIKQDRLDEFANFLRQLVKRYKDPPYSVKYWELGNEPDAPYQLRSGDEPFGCWGDRDDRDGYGGGYYALMLKHAYPAIKAADPDAQVLIGGLLYDWEDPGGRPMINFLRGVLAAGGGDYFDILSYHSYHYDGRWDNWGGGTLGKTNHIRQTMLAYGVYKPLIMSEGAYRTYDNPALFEAQANYVVTEYVRAFYLELWSYIWYGMRTNNFDGSALLNSDDSPRPAYHAYQTLTAQLGDLYYDHKMSVGETGYADVEGHMFQKADQTKWVLWSSSGVARKVVFRTSLSPTGQFRRTNKYGNARVVSDGDDGVIDGRVKISVNAPVYVEAVE